MTAQAKRQKQQYVKVMYRFTDPKRRQEIAREFERRHGKPMSDPDAFNMTVAFPIDHFGFKGAFEEAKQYIANEKSVHFNTYEWRIDGGEW